MEREKNSSREEVVPCRILNQKQAMLLNVLFENWCFLGMRKIQASPIKQNLGSS